MIDLREQLGQQPPEEGGEEDSIQGMLERTRREYEQVKKELEEINNLIKQSTSEVERLAQRNAQIANRQRQVESSIETFSRQEIKEIYSSAQEAQQRLFMMRGQVEQLQAKQQHLERYAEGLKRVLDSSAKLLPSGKGGDGEDTADSFVVRTIQAQENERLHLSRQMHDGPAQSLTNLILQAEICERLFDTDPVRARTELGNLKVAVNGTFQKVREFIFELRPMMLDDLGLMPTVRRYVQDFDSKNDLTCSLNITGKERRLASHAEVTVFRVIQSLLNNVRDHANATHVQIMMDISDELVTASVEDDGMGFDVAETLAAARARKTMGIATIMDQVELLGGEIEFDSSIGRGTKVTLRLPTQD